MGENITVSLLGAEDITVISQVGHAVALERSSVEDVHYRNDSMK